MKINEGNALFLMIAILLGGTLLINFIAHLFIFGL